MKSSETQNDGRRSFLGKASLALAAIAFGGRAVAGCGDSGAGRGWWGQSPGATPPPSAPPFKLGLVTYDLAKDWDVETIIKNCEAGGFEGVELRTTHRHGVEPSITKDQRAEVRKRFEDSRVRLVSLGSTCEYE